MSEVTADLDTSLFPVLQHKGLHLYRGWLSQLVGRRNAPTPRNMHPNGTAIRKQTLPSVMRLQKPKRALVKLLRLSLMTGSARPRESLQSVIR